MKYVVCFLILTSKVVTAQTANEWVNRGTAKILANNFEGAINDFNAAIKINPTLILAFRGRAVCHRRLGRNQDALADYNQAIKINPKHKVAISERGELKVEMGDFKGAVDDFTMIINGIDSLNKSAYNSRGVAYMRMHNYMQAMHDLNKAIRLDQKYSISYMDRGLLMIRLKAYDKAISDFDIVTVYQPRNVQAYGNRGYAKYKMKRYSEALNDLTMSIDINPSYAYAFNIRAYTNYYLQKYEDALADVNKAIKLQPKDASYYDSRGEIYYLTKKPKPALIDFSKAIKLNPQYRHAYIYRCLVNLQLKDIEAAKEDYRKVNEIIPNYNSDSEMLGYELLQQSDQLGFQPVKLEKPTYDSSYSDIVGLWFKQEVVKDTASTTSEKKVYTTFIGERAEPVGGLAAFYKFISENLQYPENARHLRQEGKVFVKFVIEESGDISNAEVVKGISYELNQEAVRVISISPKWKPGKQSGKTVKQTYTLPVEFRLQGLGKR